MIEKREATTPGLETQQLALIGIDRHPQRSRIVHDDGGRFGIHEISAKNLTPAIMSSNFTTRDKGTDWHFSSV